MQTEIDRGYAFDPIENSLSVLALVNIVNDSECSPFSGKSVGLSVT